MVNPIIRNPNQDPEEAVKRASEQKRRAPPKVFDEALEQVDQRQKPQDDDSKKAVADSKKGAGGISMKKKEDSTPRLMSPFDLARSAKKNDDGDTGGGPGGNFPGEEDAPEISLTDASLSDPTLTNVSLPPSKKQIKPFDIDHLSSTDAPPKTQVKAFDMNDDKLFARKATKPSSSFEAVEQPDLDTINPQGYLETRVAPPPLATAIEPIDNKAQAPLPRPIHEIMNEVVKQIDVLQSEGKTETTIDLKGTFEGSHLVITQFDSDKNAMNITFDNLTAKTQGLLDANKNTLIKNLDDINIHVHIFIASSTIELNPAQIAKSDTRQPEEQKERNPRESREGRKQNRDQEA
jgi:hypothetical protein